MKWFYSVTIVSAMTCLIHAYFQLEQFNVSYWELIKTLWSTWLAFGVIILMLLPMTISMVTLLFNDEIKQAKKEKTKALEQINAIKRESQNKINNAYQTQLKRVQQELNHKINELKKRTALVTHREEQIQRKESRAQELTEQAQIKLEHYQRAYQHELNQFNTQIAEIKRARDNAQSAYKRLKSKRK